MMKNDYAIRLNNITVAYDGNPVLYDCSIGFLKGKMTAIVGPNGAGKSTLLNTVLESIDPLTGDIQYNIDGKNYNSYKEVITNVAYVPQKASVDWDFPTTVYDVTLMGRYGNLGVFQRPTKKDKDIATSMLEKVGMQDFKDRQISQLSGGQRQRVFIARALTEQADIIILDEPLAGVDKTTETVIMSLLKELVAEGKTIVVVHHDLNTIETYFDQIVFLDKTVITQGAVEDVFTEENIEKTYNQHVSVNKVGDIDE